MKTRAGCKPLWTYTLFALQLQSSGQDSRGQLDYACSKATTKPEINTICRYHAATTSRSNFDSVLPRSMERNTANSQPPAQPRLLDNGMTKEQAEKKQAEEQRLMQEAQAQAAKKC
ncbi:hypothetical protein AA0121_g13357 [Alternaria tenuissima]|nr:hypothetical protein AA0121_g13357 [Alternaria tenuissima]